MAQSSLPEPRPHFEEAWDRLQGAAKLLAAGKPEEEADVLQPTTGKTCHTARPSCTQMFRGANLEVILDV